MNGRRPDYKPELRDRAAEIYGRVGSIRATAEIMDLSYKRAYDLLDDAGVIRKKGVKR